MSLEPSPPMRRVVDGTRAARIAASVGACMLLAACAVPSERTQALPFFPRLAPSPPGLHDVRLTALLEGTLVVEDGCVKVRALDASQTTTVLWHPGIELDRDRAGLLIREPRTGLMARFGVPARFGGGSAPAEYIERAYPDVAQRCGPPYASGYPSESP